MSDQVSEGSRSEQEGSWIASILFTSDEKSTCAEFALPTDIALVEEMGLEG